MKTLLFTSVFFVGCGANVQDPLLSPDLKTERSDMARTAGNQDMATATIPDLAPTTQPDLAQPDFALPASQDMARPIVDMAQAPRDMEQPCGQPGQHCCPSNPNNICVAATVACRYSDNICAYCGAGGQICCAGDTCPHGAPGQTLTCILRPGDTQKTCN